MAGKWPWVRRRRALWAAALLLCRERPPEHTGVVPERERALWRSCCGTCMKDAEEALRATRGRGWW